MNTPSQWMSGILVAAVAGVAFGQAGACTPKHPGAAAPQAQAAATGSVQGVVFAPPKPPSPSEPPAITKTGNVYTDRFLALWYDLHRLGNGYFSPQGIPYHSVETLLCEAPDYGHETTSEAFSYYVWLEAMYGKVTQDWSWLERAWAVLEYYMIPQSVDQPTNRYYPFAKPATYAEERDLPNDYPVKLDGAVPVGRDPIANELKQTYNTSDVYAMHWLLDVDNWYGYGQRGDGTTRPSYINTFQRGTQESVWETVTHPCWEEFKWGHNQPTAGNPRPVDGFLGLFIDQAAPAKQWKYSAAPDADARAIQALYWAKRWADEQGKGAAVGQVIDKGRMLGDFVRYALFDKYFKTVPCTQPQCPGGQGYESAMYLINWYFAWGGSMPSGAFGWAWRIGSSHNHSGYQNPMAAYALSQFDPLKPKSPSGVRDWGTSLGRQLEFYRWLQSKQGGIAGGATNSWKGRYGVPPGGTTTFYGMAYDPSPVYSDPPSNNWFGFQVWTMQRVAEYYYVTGDPKAKLILDPWVQWALANSTVKRDDFEIPSDLEWSGQPDLHWNQATQNWQAGDPTYNANLQVKVISRGPDVGTAAGLVHTLAFYAAKSNHKAARTLAKDLLDRMWNKYRDPKGLVNQEARKDYRRFADKVYVPKGWVGVMPSGASINEQSTFMSLRPQYLRDPDWPKVKAYLDGGKPPEFKYHRFWAQAHIALAYATYGWLFPEDKG
jgi:hypothetical protein